LKNIENDITKFVENKKIPQNHPKTKKKFKSKGLVRRPQLKKFIK
jgi:hypothetical protein